MSCPPWLRRTTDPCTLLTTEGDCELCGPLSGTHTEHTLSLLSGEQQDFQNIQPQAQCHFFPSWETERCPYFCSSARLGVFFSPAWTGGIMRLGNIDYGHLKVLCSDSWGTVRYSRRRARLQALFSSSRCHALRPGMRKPGISARETGRGVGTTRKCTLSFPDFAACRPRRYDFSSSGGGRCQRRSMYPDRRKTLYAGNPATRQCLAEKTGPAGSGQAKREWLFQETQQVRRFPCLTLWQERNRAPVVSGRNGTRAWKV